MNKLLLASLSTLICVSTSYAEGEVKVKGRLSVSNDDLPSAMVVVEVDGKTCMPASTYANGLFSFKLSESSKAAIVIYQEGFTTKEVLIDTRNIWSTKSAKKKNRTIKFDIELLPRSFEDDLIYAGPVGTIWFLKGLSLIHI